MSNLETKESKQQRRLKYIDLCSFVLGYVTRKLVMDRFQVGGAYASRDLNEYLRVSYDRIVYNNQQKRYVPVDWFTPLYEHDVKEALELVSKGTFTEVCIERNNSNSAKNQMPVSLPKLDIVAPALRAVCTEKKADIGYLSRSSGLTRRLIAPHSIFFVSHFYYLRAFDHQSGEFRSFKINRITESHYIDKDPDLSMSKIADKDWNTKLKVTIGAQLGLQNSDAIEHDYSLLGGTKVLEMKKALLWYYLMDWNIAPPEYNNLPLTLFPLCVLKLEEV